MSKENELLFRECRDFIRSVSSSGETKTFKGYGHDVTILYETDAHSAWFEIKFNYSSYTVSDVSVEISANKTELKLLDLLLTHMEKTKDLYVSNNQFYHHPAVEPRYEDHFTSGGGRVVFTRVKTTHEYGRGVVYLENETMFKMENESGEDVWSALKDMMFEHELAEFIDEQMVEGTELAGIANGLAKGGDDNDS